MLSFEFQELIGPLRVAGLEVLGASGEDHVMVSMGFRHLGQGGSARDWYQPWEVIPRRKGSFFNHP